MREAKGKKYAAGALLRATCGLTAAVLVACWPAAGLSQGGRILVPDPRAESPAEQLHDVRLDTLRAAHQVFAVIAEAWSAADHSLLAELVSPDGVSIAVAPDPERENLYSPDQAYYFFKNLFRSARTDSFHFSRLQEEATGGLVHAVGDWRYRRAAADDPGTERLIFTLVRTDSDWRLAEIRTIR